MSAPILQVQNLAVTFGGVKAVNDISFAIEPGEVFTLIGPNGAGKTTVFNLISRIYNPTRGKIFFQGNDITNAPAHRIANLGIARTFQNIELFEQATVLQNLLIGRHVHRSTSLWQELLFTPAVRRSEIDFRDQVENSSTYSICNTTAIPMSPVCPMACVKWSSSVARLRFSQNCC